MGGQRMTVSETEAREARRFLARGGEARRYLITGAARVTLFAAITLGVSGCQEIAPTDGPAAAAVASNVTGENPGDVKYYRSDEPIRLGYQRFNHGTSDSLNTISEML